MGHKPRTPEEILTELKQVVSEARGIVNDLNAGLKAARQEIPTLVMEAITSDIKELLDAHRNGVREITAAWDELVESKFTQLNIEMQAMIKRYVQAIPGPGGLGIDTEEDQETASLAIQTIYSVVGSLAQSDAKKGILKERREFNERIDQRRRGKIPAVREEAGGTSD